MRARWATLRLLGLRGLLADPPSALAVAAIVAVSAAVVAAVPPALERWEAGGLRHEAERASPRERDVEVVQAVRLDAAALQASKAERLRELPPRLAAAVGSSSLVTDTPRYAVVPLPGEAAPEGTTRYVTLRVQEQLGRLVRLAEGREPAPSAARVRLPADWRADAAPVLEIALSAVTAEALSVALDDTLVVAPDHDQALLTFVPYLDRPPVALRVVGLFEPIRPEGAEWFADTRAFAPIVEDTETQRFVYAYGLLPSSAYPSLLGATGAMPLTVRWRHRVEPRSLRPRDVAVLEAELRRLELRYGAVPEHGAAEPEARTGLARVLARYRRERLLATTTLAFAGTALLALALIVLAAAAVAGGERHRAALSLARDRGGSRGAVAGSAAVAALAAALPAALAGAAVALAVAGRVDTRSVVLAAAVAVAGGAAVTAALSSRPAGVRRSGGGAQRRRATFDLLLVAAAAGSVAFARTRGGEQGTFDPYLLAAPALIVLATWVATLRLLPPATAVLARTASGRRGLVAPLALRRLARRPRSSAVLLGVALVTAAIATFSSLAGGEGATASPLREGASTALRIAAGLGVGYGSLAVGLAVAVAVRTRVEEDADLAAVGVSRRQRLSLGLVEFVPVALVGVTAGIVAGGISYLAVRPALLLRAAGILGPEVALAAFAVPAAAAVAVLAAAHHGWRKKDARA
jgi:putative ABC transport system permease protein